MKNPKSSYLWLTALCLSAGSAALSAQTTAPAGLTPAAANSDQVVQMSQFVVQTTQGMGYVDANSVSGFKTNQSLLDIPQAELVLTQDFIKDIPFTKNIADLLRVVGYNSFYRSGGAGEGTMVRGSRISVALTDGMIAPGWFDSYFLDSFEILKGLAAALYQGTSTTGALLKTSKKPLPYEQNVVGLQADSQGLIRGTVDSTGPVGTLGDSKVGYRLVLSDQHGGQYFANDPLDIWAIHLTTQLEYKASNLILAYDYDHFYGNYNSNGVLTPTGDIFKGAGRQYEGLWMPNMYVNSYNRGMRAIFDQKFSENWEMRLAADFWYQQEFGGNAVNTAVNWQTNTFSGIFRQNDSPADEWQLTDDVTGKYSFGIINCSSTFGFAHSDNTSYSKFLTLTRPGLANTFSIPLGPNTPAVLDSTYVPQKSAGDYPVPANPGTRSKTYQDLLYGQEQVDAIPNLLTLQAGWAMVQTEAITDTNISFNTPFAATDVNFHTWIPRLGAVVHVTKGISLYGLYATNAAVQSVVDINNNRVPNALTHSKEFGLKSSLLDGRLVADVAWFDTVQTNQTVFSGLTNFAGVGYYIPVGTTTNLGEDASLAYSPLPGYQIIATGYKGTVLDQNHNWISPSYGNSWSFFNRYDFAKGTALEGVGFGFGVDRIGNRYLTTTPMTFPTGWVKPAYIKIHEGTDAIAFLDYHFLKHWDAHLSCTNVLDSNYPIGTQSVTVVDPSPPRTVTLTATVTF